jgi:hypothetical protein
VHHWHRSGSVVGRHSFGAHVAPMLICINVAIRNGTDRTLANRWHS